MLSSSDSDDLPGLVHVIASRKSKRTRTSCHSSRVRKKQKTQVNTKARGNAASLKHYQSLAIPIELTSEDEHQCRNPKSKLNNAKNNTPLAQVIDLCSDAEGVSPLLHPSKDFVPPSQETVSTVSSENDDIGPSSLSNHATLPDDVQYPPKRGQQLLVERMRREKRKGREAVGMNAKEPMLWQEEEEEASNNASEPIICPLPRKWLRGSHSPVLIVPSRRISLPCASSPQLNETQSFPSSEESGQCPVSDQLFSSEAEESTKPLQSVYDDIFRNMPHSEGDITLSLGFEPFDMNSTPPPLLTPSFFERARQPLLSLPDKSSRTKFAASNQTHKRPLLSLGTLSSNDFGYTSMDFSQKSRLIAPKSPKPTSLPAVSQSEVTISTPESRSLTKMRLRASSSDQSEITSETLDVELLEMPKPVDDTEIAFITSRCSTTQGSLGQVDSV